MVLTNFNEVFGSEKLISDITEINRSYRDSLVAFINSSARSDVSFEDNSKHMMRLLDEQIQSFESTMTAFRLGTIGMKIVPCRTQEFIVRGEAVFLHSLGIKVINSKQLRQFNTQLKLGIEDNLNRFNSALYHPFAGQVVEEKDIRSEIANFQSTLRLFFNIIRKTFRDVDHTPNLLDLENLELLRTLFQQAGLSEYAEYFTTLIDHANEGNQAEFCLFERFSYFPWNSELDTFMESPRALKSLSLLEVYLGKEWKNPFTPAREIACMKQLNR